jgi:hypothetical protein
MTSSASQAPSGSSLGTSTSETGNGTQCSPGAGATWGQPVAVLPELATADALSAITPSQASPVKATIPDAVRSGHIG